LIPERIPLFARASTALLLLASLAACGTLFKKDEAVQGVVNSRVIGMSAGEFFDQFGVWRQRTELLDGTTEFSWTSAIASRTAAGYVSLDDRTCTLRIIVAKSGKITSADVVFDNQGRVSTSRCAELFRTQ
jgi:hypothetical protein